MLILDESQNFQRGLEGMHAPCMKSGPVIGNMFCFCMTKNQNNPEFQIILFPQSILKREMKHRSIVCEMNLNRLLSPVGQILFFPFIILANHISYKLLEAIMKIKIISLTFQLMS